MIGDEVEIHKPHAAKSWREFSVEIGTIVLGILIALSLEQAVEAVHWKHRVADAEEAMLLELKKDNRDSYYRLAVEPCARAKLDEIEAQLVASHSSDAPVVAITPYVRPLRPWLSDAWDSARALQITSHIPAERLALYSRAYFFATTMRATQPREREAISQLNTLTINAGHLQPAERDRLFLALERARDANYEMTGAAWLHITRTGLLGISLTAQDRSAELAAARQDFGNCAAAPDLAKPPVHSDTASRAIK